VASKQQPDGRYRGRRRLPKLPSARYAAVVSFAMVGAAVIAFGAGAFVPESSPSGADGGTQAMSIEDRLSAVDKANRSDARNGGGIATVDQGAPDVWLLPLKVDYRITTLYEMRWGAFHSGMDLAAPYGTPIYAAHAGTVLVSSYYGGYGNCVIMDVGNGVTVYYGHQSALTVVEGQQIKAGQLLGYVGSTGQSTGNHLHFELRLNGEAVDPKNFMLARGVDLERRLEAATGGNVKM
jgi:murein DD-endopeptidase MepM/ murein hydrolase activator NlpD